MPPAPARPVQHRFTAGPAADHLTHPLHALILRACADRARSPRYLATTLGVTLTTVRAHIDHLTAAGLLAAEAPSRISGRLVTPYRTMPRAAATLRTTSSRSRRR